jgi:hypothetical protein
MDIIPIIDDLLRRELLSSTRTDLLAYQANARAGDLRSEDETYIRNLHSRLKNRPRISTAAEPRRQQSENDLKPGPSRSEKLFRQLKSGAKLIIILSLIALPILTLTGALNDYGNLGRILAICSAFEVSVVAIVMIGILALLGLWITFRVGVFLLRQAVVVLITILNIAGAAWRGEIRP